MARPPLPQLQGGAGRGPTLATCPPAAHPYSPGASNHLDTHQLAGSAQAASAHATHTHLRRLLLGKQAHPQGPGDRGNSTWGWLATPGYRPPAPRYTAHAVNTRRLAPCKQALQRAIGPSCFTWTDHTGLGSGSKPTQVEINAVQGKPWMYRELTWRRELTWPQIHQAQRCWEWG
jgi:hypothetical protein